MVDAVSPFPSKFGELIIKSQISVTLVFIYLFIIWIKQNQLNSKNLFNNAQAE